MTTTKTTAKPERGTRSGGGEGRRGSAPTPSAETKATLACMEYAYWSAMVREAGKQIGKHLAACPGEDGRAYRDTRDTHLSAYYGATKTYRDDLEADEVYDTREAMRACPHCAAAHQVVEDRKTYRQRLGAAKRAIVHAAKACHAALGLVDPEEQARQLFLASQGDLFKQQEGAGA